MKTRMISLALLATTVIGTGAFVASNAVAQQLPHTNVVVTANAEKHPEIRKAMRQLNSALTTMQKAADDFHGHKAAAMDLTRKAMEELKAALASDRH